MYRAPVKDIRFVLDELIGGDALRACPEFADYSSETADAVLGEAARFAETILDPLCKSGDREGAHWSANGVTMPEGFRAAYLQFCESGWPALRAETEFGGQNVPAVLGTAVEELWAGANLAFKLCPMLTQGAIAAIDQVGPDEIKKRFLPNMVAGKWTGTMNLTEPQATPLRAPSDPSALTRTFGTTNSDTPLMPLGAPSIRASTRWMMFSARSCSPAEMKILVPVIL